MRAHGESAVVNPVPESVPPTVTFLADTSVVDVISGWYVFNAVWTAVEMGLLRSLVLFTFPSPTMDAVIPATVPVNVGLLVGAFAAMSVAIEVEKFGSLPSAAANSFSVSSRGGAAFTMFATAVSTYVCVA